MRTLLIIPFLIAIISHEAHSQVTAGVKFGISPSVRPQTAHLIVNRHDPSREFLFNIERVDFSPQVGLMVKTGGQDFWFMAEALLSRSRSTYSITPTSPDIFPAPDSENQLPDPNGNWPNYTQEITIIDLPLSAGVNIGVLQMYSGFHATFELSNKGTLSEHPEFTSAMSSSKFGWHSGVSLNFNRILFDFRYQQHFSNYGQGLFVGSKEMIFKNAPGRATMSVAFQF